jgi:hypothetical protein
MDLAARSRACTHAYAMIALIVLLSAADAVVTLIGIHRRLFVELNPLLRAAFEGSDVGAFVAVKGSLTLLWAAVMTREAHRRWLVFVHVAVATAYVAVIASSVLRMGVAYEFRP